MKILVDAHMVGENETGNETFIIGLIQGMIALNSGNEIILAVSNPEVAGKYVAGAAGVIVERISANPFPRLVWELPRLAARHKADAMFCTYAGPPLPGCKLGIIFHDLSFRRNPKWFSWRDRCVLRVGVGLSIRRADIVFALSEHTKKEIVSLYRRDAADIHVTWAGVKRYPVDPDAEPHEKEEPLPQRGISEPYIVAVGNLQPRKNLKRLLYAYNGLQALGLQQKLVIVGRAFWRESEIEHTVDRLNLRDRVVFTGYVDESALRVLYRRSDALAYPSLYEGFGLPILEAMACGVPCVVSGTTALPEVGGDACCYVNPESTDSIREGLVRVLTNPGYRDELVKKGYERCRFFTWEKTAERVLRALV